MCSRFKDFISALLCRFLLENGADKSILTEEGERPLDLVDPSDMETIRVMLSDVSGNNDSQSDDERDQQDLVS